MGNTRGTCWKQPRQAPTSVINKKAINFLYVSSLKLFAKLGFIKNLAPLHFYFLLFFLHRDYTDTFGQTVWSNLSSAIQVKNNKKMPIFIFDNRVWSWWLLKMSSIPPWQHQKSFLFKPALNIISHFWVSFIRLCKRVYFIVRPLYAGQEKETAILRGGTFFVDLAIF